MNWQSIETAPKDGTDILIFRNGRIEISRWIESGDVEYGKIIRERKYWLSSPFYWSLEELPPPTHWMRLPIPPAKEINQ